MKLPVRSCIFVATLPVMPNVWACNSNVDDSDIENLLDLNIKELLQVVATDVGSLTDVERAKAPAAVTRLCQSDIQVIGARSLDELLEITVPGLQVIRHHWELPHMGLRGITSDKEDKIMIRVNGRVMNERLNRGAITERDFPLMRDIKYINIIRGAGSSMFGLGAVTMVIDIVTYSAEDAPENGMSVRVGGGLAYKAADVNVHKRFDNGIGMYFHTEWADVEGANDNDAPLVFAVDATSIATGERIRRGEPFPTSTRDGEGYAGKPFLKTHLSLDYGNTEFWARYTRGGRNETPDLGVQALQPEGWPNVGPNTPLGPMKVGFEQFTATVQTNKKISERLDLDVMLSYDDTSSEKIQPPRFESSRYEETEIFAKVVAQWKASDKSKFAFGAEYSAEKFVRDSEDDAWRATTWSLLGEWQWQPIDKITTFLGGRVDENSYSAQLFSPRASIIYTPDDQNTWKLMMTRSERMNLAKDNRRVAQEGNEQSDKDTLHGVEARYERATDDSFLGISTYYIDLDSLGWDGTQRKNVLVGNQKQWGIETEWEKRLGNHRFQWSASYNELLSFDLFGRNTLITAAPFGYGNDLADWAKYSTKFQYYYKKDEKTSFSSSLRAFWHYDGSEDYYEKRVDDGNPRVAPGWDKGYGPQIYLNLGAQRKLSKNSTLSLHLYNTLGLIDKDLNKRLFRNSFGDYRSEAAAFSVGFSANF